MNNSWHGGKPGLRLHEVFKPGVGRREPAGHPAGPHSARGRHARPALPRRRAGATAEESTSTPRPSRRCWSPTTTGSPRPVWRRWPRPRPASATSRRRPRRRPQRRRCRGGAGVARGRHRPGQDRRRRAGAGLRGGGAARPVRHRRRLRRPRRAAPDGRVRASTGARTPASASSTRGRSAPPSPPATSGFPALAISIDSTRPPHFDTAATVAASAMGWLLHAPPAPCSTSTCPTCPSTRCEACGRRRWPVSARSRRPCGAQTAVGTRSWSASGGAAGGSDAGTDAALLAAGFVTVTCVVGVRFGGWTGVGRADQRGPSVS